MREIFIACLVTAGCVRGYAVFRRPVDPPVVRARSRWRLLIAGTALSLWTLAVAWTLPVAAEMTLGGMLMMSIFLSTWPLR